MKRKSLTTLILTALLLSAATIYSAAASACGSEHTPPRDFAPVIFVHGFLGSGDTWAPQVQRFASNGVSADRLFAYDWNSLAMASDGNALLDRFVDSVLQVTGASAIHLVGHSAGGGLCYAYLSDASHAAKISSYVHIGSGANRIPAGPYGSVPTLNIYSDADRVVKGGDIPGAENVRLSDHDHYEVATSRASFAAMYRFFYGDNPATTEVVPSERVVISGKALTLGTNEPAEGILVEMFVADDSGNPSGDAVGKFQISASGHWGPYYVEPDTRYMFYVTSNRQGFRNLYYYYEPFIRDNPLVYLRVFPPPVSAAGLLLSGLPVDDNRSVIALFSSSQAVISGRDEMRLNDFVLSTEELASESATSISFFCFDDKGDGKGDAEPMSTFVVMPFLQGADIPVFTSVEETWQAVFNGRTIPVRNFKSRSEGIVIAVFR